MELISHEADHWFAHCQDAAAFLSEVGYAELAPPSPEALDQLRLDLRLSNWHDAAQLEHFLTHLGEGANAVLFRCTVCGSHLFSEPTRTLLTPTTSAA
ncbi:CbrC family protein [Streptomyces sp. MZ04]|uniref:CbrC family protein n=1 Tax=Streptomyces sp. MZ04 TaxID=2559236 RepID=UPI001FD79ED0|nr:CbrC family protein [Streptomyces sp. MZ04]